MSEERTKRSVFMEGSNILRYRKKWEEEEKAEEERKRLLQEKSNNEGNEKKVEASSNVRVEKDANNNPMGKLGQRFNFKAVAGENISETRLAQLEKAFRENIDKQINQTKRSYISPNGNTIPISLDIYDHDAPVVNVIISEIDDDTYTIVPTREIHIAADNILDNSNAPTHEWLHIAGLMDRYYEVYTYSYPFKADGKTEDKTKPIELSVRADTFPMNKLPKDYDKQYEPINNMMSDRKNQITNQQWGLILNEKNERKEGGLGVVSMLLYFQDYAKPSTYELHKTQFSYLSFTATKAFKNNIPLVIMNLQNENYIIHLERGNLYPDYGEIRVLYETYKENEKKEKIFYNKTRLDSLSR